MSRFGPNDLTLYPVDLASRAAEFATSQREKAAVLRTMRLPHPRLTFAQALEHVCATPFTADDLNRLECNQYVVTNALMGAYQEAAQWLRDHAVVRSAQET